MKMLVQDVSFASVTTVGPQSWREDTVRSIRRAEELVRKTRAGQLSFGPWQQRSRTFTTQPAGCSQSAHAEADGQSDSTTHVRKPLSKTYDRIRPRSTGATNTFPSPSLRERAGVSSVCVAVGYMRSVRQVEGLLRGRAAQVALESTKLERQQEHLERMLITLRKDLLVNKRSMEDRALRPAGTETSRDGADTLLDCERRELTKLKVQLESTLRDTLSQLQKLGECSKMLLECARERSRVLDFLPTPGSLSAGARRSPAQASLKPSPTGPYTPECEKTMDSSALALSQSQQLRDLIRQMLGEAVTRQRAAQQSVNEGLAKKIAETVTLQHRLSLSSAVTRQAICRKQRQLGIIEHSHGRALGPVSSRDLFSRERLDRPLVQVYQRHPGTKLPEAMHLTQGVAALRQGLLSSGGELAQLNDAHLRLVEDLRGKGAASQVDSGVVRLRRRHMESRGTSFLLQGIC